MHTDRLKQLIEAIEAERLAEYKSNAWHRSGSWHCETSACAAGFCAILDPAVDSQPSYVLRRRKSGTIDRQTYPVAAYEYLGVGPTDPARKTLSDIFRDVDMSRPLVIAKLKVLLQTHENTN